MTSPADVQERLRALAIVARRELEAAAAAGDARAREALEIVDRGAPRLVDVPRPRIARAEARPPPRHWQELAEDHERDANPT